MSFRVFTHRAIRHCSYSRKFAWQTSQKGFRCSCRRPTGGFARWDPSPMRIGVRDALQRNLCTEKGLLVHNARVIITNVHRRSEVRFPNDLESHCIPCISFNFSPPSSDWTVTRKQFPLRLAYATTFDGCQGLTLARSVSDLRVDSFAHGQLYTAR